MLGTKDGILTIRPVVTLSTVLACLRGTLITFPAVCLLTPLKPYLEESSTMDSDGITWEIFLSNLFCPFQNLGEIRPLSHVGDRLKTLLTLYSRNEEEFCEANGIIPLPPKSINFLHQLCSLLNEETESTARFSTVLAYVQGIRDGEEGHPWHVVSFVGFLARVLRPSTRVTFANVQNVDLKS